MFKYYLFDLDGTLTDPALGITNSFIYALKSFGMEIPSYERLCTFIGPPFNMAQCQQGVKKYREYFSQKGLFENTVYDKIPELLEELKKQGKHLLVATSKPEEYSVKILEHFNLSSYFDFICGSNMDESRSKKEEVIEYALSKIGNPSKDQVLMIGDREYDIIGAKKNGLKSCGVLFGYGSLEELEKAGADFIAPTVMDILKIN